MTVEKIERLSLNTEFAVIAKLPKPTKCAGCNANGYFYFINMLRFGGKDMIQAISAYNKAISHVKLFEINTYNGAHDQFNEDIDLNPSIYTDFEKVYIEFSGYIVPFMHSKYDAAIKGIFVGTDNVVYYRDFELYKIEDATVTYACDLDMFIREIPLESAAVVIYHAEHQFDVEEYVYASNYSKMIDKSTKEFIIPADLPHWITATSKYGNNNAKMQYCFFVNNKDDSKFRCRYKGAEFDMLGCGFSKGFDISLSNNNDLVIKALYSEIAVDVELGIPRAPKEFTVLFDIKGETKAFNATASGYGSTNGANFLVLTIENCPTYLEEALLCEGDPVKVTIVLE